MPWEAGLYLVMAANERWESSKFSRRWVIGCKSFRLYQRDSEGRVVKNFDHAMDAMRLLDRKWPRPHESQNLWMSQTFQLKDWNPADASNAWMS
jgi:hypothetical protein